VHLVAFIVRIYHDARSPECQTQIKIWLKTREISHHRMSQKLEQQLQHLFRAPFRL